MELFSRYDIIVLKPLPKQMYPISIIEDLVTIAVYTDQILWCVYVVVVCGIVLSFCDYDGVYCCEVGVL